MSAFPPQDLPRPWGVAVSHYQVEGGDVRPALRRDRGVRQAIGCAVRDAGLGRALALVLLASAGARAEETCGPLFVIARSLNANVVLYEAAYRRDGTLDPEKPLTVSWRLDAQDGRREGLNFIERMRAYGVSS